MMSHAITVPKDRTRRIIASIGDKSPLVWRDAALSRWRKIENYFSYSIQD